jgi:SDR family mycofactocin-dependent oxidoreductase
MGRMDGKVVLVTGAGRGQGRSHALRLAQEGADILAIDCPPDSEAPYPLATRAELDDTVRQVEELDRRILAVAADVRDRKEMDSLVERGIAEFGHIDAVVANAAVWGVAPFWEIPDEQWRYVLDVNVLGVVNTLRAVTPHMIERGAGSMIVIASVNGVEGGPNYAHYIASKHAVLGLMKSVALELGPHGIRCNAVLPGVINTPILRWQGGYDLMAGGPGLGTPDHLDQGARVFHLLKDTGMLPPQATSEGVLWLASDDSRWVTGLELVIDAGHRVMPGYNMAAMAAQQPGG